MSLARIAAVAFVLMLVAALAIGWLLPHGIVWAAALFAAALVVGAFALR